MSSPLAVPVKKPKSDVLPAQPWLVIVLDDPVNTIEYVIHVLRKVFQFSKPIAEKHTMAVHTRGRSVVWSGDREKAELYVSQLQSFQLQATLERSE